MFEREGGAMLSLDRIEIGGETIRIYKYPRWEMYRKFTYTETHHPTNQNVPFSTARISRKRYIGDNSTNHNRARRKPTLNKWHTKSCHSFFLT